MGRRGGKGRASVSIVDDVFVQTTTLPVSSLPSELVFTREKGG